MKRLALALILVLAAFLVATAAASNLPPAGSGSISLNQTNVSLGDLVNFTSSYPGNLKNPRIEVLCYQDGTLAYGEAGSSLDWFQLGGNPDGGSIWASTGGPADCTANLFYWASGNHEWNGGGQQTYVLLGTTSFAANG